MDAGGLLSLVEVEEQQGTKEEAGWVEAKECLDAFDSRSSPVVEHRASQ
jgi:hypothetical protein